MAKRKTKSSPSIQDIIELLAVKHEAGNELLIVNSTILRRLLSLLTPDSLDQLLSKGLPEGPEANTPFSTWVKLVRQQMGLSQRDFAAAIREKNVKIHGSDIGNIERNLRPEDYTPERIEEFKTAILKVIKDRETLPSMST